MSRTLRSLAICASLAVVSTSFAQMPDAQRPDAQSARALETRAEAVTKQIGELASSGKLPTSEEGIALLRKLVDELAAIRAELKALRSDPKSVEAVQTDGRTRLSGYLQFQYRDTDQPGGQADAFQIRRARLNLNHQADTQTLVRLSVDFATGANQLQAQLRDAFAQVTWDAVEGLGRLQAQAGQFSIPISSQLIRGDLEREFPERTAYMNSLFNGERSRGVVVRSGSGGTSFLVGAMNALTINDPEQVNVAPGPGSRLAAFGSVQLGSQGVTGALSYFAGERAATTNNAVAVPKTDRRWLILNAAYDDPARSKLSVRGEYMTGEDRVPGASTAPLMAGTDMRAWHLQAGYRFSRLDGVYVRYEDWNRNTSAPGFGLTGIGVAYRRILNPAIELIGAWEQFDDEMLPKKYQITTIRLQYRF